MNKQITIQKGTVAREYLESARLYSFAELKQMPARAGLSIEQTFGDYRGHAFKSHSPLLIIMGKHSAG